MEIDPRSPIFTMMRACTFFPEDSAEEQSGGLVANYDGEANHYNHPTLKKWKGTAVDVSGRLSTPSKSQIRHRYCCMHQKGHARLIGLIV